MQITANKKVVSSETVTASPGKRPVRLQSLDALRGFDMFWIMSGEIVVHSLADATHAPAANWMSHQLSHSPWNGFTFYDLIFPLFIFIAGVSMPFSFSSQLEKGSSKKKIYGALIKRTLILIFLGMVVNGLFKWQGYENTRIASVLGRIALSCFFAAVIYLNSNLKQQVLWFAGLLLGYWAAMMLIPVPQFGAGNLTPEGNLAAYIDRLLLPGKLHRKVYDPEGLLSTIPAIGSAMLGVFAGEFLRWRQTQWNEAKKAAVLAIAGLILLAAGWVWNIVFPINKTMWTSSFVLCAGGWSALFLSLFYFVIDVAGWKKWSMPLVWIGMNSILIYVAAHGLINFEATASYLFGGLIKFTDVKWQPFWLAIGIVLVQMALLYFLYRKKWFLKV
ncbi:DUF5009 domain-containing protein [Chitinophagaceae bacterium LB-8]|uniref:DUF5009 domain-containing protein n=1 Tax=Paraflavisolibacter caeni TaxID=2982496 RepID=A0A9X2XYI3_9BACT|nr:DUF5009 domain-containing protein [Paraflavisolibacter caeni]MCU7551157.1 DUF5009 domain-containing protein [Paraflavisolibacter caeni]